MRINSTTRPHPSITGIIGHLSKTVQGVEMPNRIHVPTSTSAAGGRHKNACWSLSCTTSQPGRFSGDQPSSILIAVGIGRP